MNFAKSNLFKLFLSLSPDEVKDLDKAVHSQFFNYRQEEILLFQYLKQHCRGDTKDIRGEDVFAQVFPKQRTDLAKLRHVMTYLTRIINRLITIRETELNEAQRMLTLTTSMRRRKLDKLFLAAYNEAKQYLMQEMPASPATYYYQLQLHTEYYSYSIADRKAKSEDLQQLSDDLDLFYLTQKLKHGCNILSYKNIFGFDYQPDLLNELQALLTKKDLLQNPLVKLLYYNYLCLSEPDNETYFTQLKENLLLKNKRIDSRELRDIYTLAINYCIKRLNTGGQKYYREVFQIYQSGLDELVFEDEGKLSPFTYKNITAIAIGLKEYKWVKAFIDDYKERLPAEYREGFYAYCLARYYFETDDYNRAAELLREVDIKEQFTDLDARVLLIKTYYEADEYNLMSYALDNLKQQLKRKKLQTYHETVYGNFAKICTRLIRAKGFDKRTKEAIKKTILSTTAIAEKAWLLSKV